MPYSICPHCGKRSYSAATMDVWHCPYCHKRVEEKVRFQDINRNKVMLVKKGQD
jgi:ribosomal protein L37AE/L43A